MIRHIVMFKMNEAKCASNILQLKDNLEDLKNKIPQIKSLETGINISKSPSAFDLILLTEFEDEKSLDLYREHPAHQEVVKFIHEAVEQVKVVDYTF